MPAQDNLTIVRSLYDNYNRRNTDSQWLDKSLAVTDQNCELLNVPMGSTLRGPDGVRQFLMGWATAFPDSTVEITSIIASEDRVAVEFIGRGTHTGPLHTPTGDIAPTGHSIEIHFCDVHTLKNGKLVSQHTYYDVMTMMRQLGRVPAMA